MNFLAHIYLSGDDNWIKIGNFMADSIHGNQYQHFLPEIQKGVKLHRLIDSYTDSHPVFKQTTKKLHAGYRHYSGVIADIFYDHFLAKNWEKYHQLSLQDYVIDFYTLLGNNLAHTPIKTQQIYPYMVEHNWLYNYRTIEGISSILYQMDRRTQFKSNMQYAPNELKLHYNEFENEFILFFNDIQKYVAEEIQKMSVNNS